MLYVYVPIAQVVFLCRLSWGLFWLILVRKLRDRNVIGTGALIESMGLGTIVLDAGEEADVSVEEEEDEE